MDSKTAILEERLKSLLVQLISETGILERIVHKNKNQHRRSPYFQALLKVRRDLRLLQSADLHQILSAIVPVINRISPAEHAPHPKLNNQKKYLHGKHTYQNRLLGVARLLSQMVEPILEAAIQISLLLAKSFFMGFSLTVLACLARFRVLVQQILIDVVSVFNMVPAHSQKHSMKHFEGCAAYQSTSADILTLECVWENDKYVLREILSPCGSANISKERESFSLKSPIEYQTKEFLGQGLGIEHEGTAVEESTFKETQPTAFSSSDRLATSVGDIESTDCEKSPIEEPACSLNSGEDLFQSSVAQISQIGLRKRVAFVAVDVSKPSESEAIQPEKKMRMDFASSENVDGKMSDFSFSASKNISLF